MKTNNIWKEEEMSAPAMVAARKVATSQNQPEYDEHQESTAAVLESRLADINNPAMWTDTNDRSDIEALYLKLDKEYGYA